MSNKNRGNEVPMSRKSIIVPEGLPFIIAAGIMTLVLYGFGFDKTAFFTLAATFFIVWFFRNPERKIPEGKDSVVSPADGKVIIIEEVRRDDLVPGSFIKISIFMNVFNVHVNRIPYSGTITLVRYTKGRFISANLDKASALNEQNAIVIATDKGREIITVQIAGLIARRIVCWIKEGMAVEKGERFGLIRFGSRLDVYLPRETSIAVKIGDKVRSGETVLGELP
jgi:phosphatidylserine decarboxylase